MPKPRHALSLVEVVVALTVVGIAVAAVAIALAGDYRLRGLAAAEEGAATEARSRLEFLAVRPCVRDTAGMSVEPWGRNAWRAVVDGRTWRLTDTLVVRRRTSAIVIETRIACAE